MARMVATKAALSIRVDALSDADSKSSADAASIGIENRAKLESRLRALEYRNDLTTTTPFKGEKKKEQPKFEMKTDVKQYNTASDAVGFFPTQRQGAEALAINAVLDVKEEKRREKAEKQRAKEEKRKRKAEAAVAAAAAASIEDEPEPGTKDSMSFACDPDMHLTHLLDAIPVSMETDQERKERRRLKKEKKRAEAAAATDAAIAAAVAPTPTGRAEGSEKKKSKKRKHEVDEMEVDGEKKKKRRRKE